MSNLGLLEITE